MFSKNQKNNNAFFAPAPQQSICNIRINKQKNKKNNVVA